VPAAGGPGPRATTRLLSRLASPTVRLLLLAPLLAVVVVSAIRSDGIGVDALRELFEGFGAAGPFVFAAVYGVAATMLLPAAPFTIGAGVLFGPVVGTATALVGATVGATGAFLLGRTLGRGAVEQFGGRRVASLDRYLTRRGFVSVLVVRLVPLFPFNLINLVAGVTGIPLRDYVLATAVGIIPGTVAYAALGGTIDDPTSPAFLAALAIFLIVTLGAGAASRRLRARSEPAEARD
jgi:uncharacterized membrane protein YdjX (TVP38/TMEM64 family)